MDEQYQPQKIEAEAQHFWDERKCFQVTEDLSKAKFYCLTMFPYPSGRLHMGHVRVFTITDMIARYQRMLGKNVLQPMGWDAFGLPAENAALKHGVAPAKWTYSNIANMRKEMHQLGFAYDWSREITTCDPRYYRWEQWFFLKLFQKGLVYKKSADVNWDPVDQTILANEQVIDGRGWRSGALVERREVPQWFLKITDYADELLNGLDKLEHWPEQIRTVQRNWIGRSIGAEILFDLPEHGEQLKVYTTRPDTLFGTTYLAIAPQHPLAKELGKQNQTIQKFLDECRNIKVAEAELATIEKKGVDTQLKATHPLTGEPLAIWIANFIVMDYGTGAIMAVPGHDQRDFEFSQKYQLPIKEVIKPEQGATSLPQAAFTEPGILIHSEKFNGQHSTEAQKNITDALAAINKGRRHINYRLRDWSISRQRYWGTPVPIINCPTCGPVAEPNLPVLLPEDVEFKGATSPLKQMPSFYQTKCPHCGKPAERETDTFDTFVESSWYYTRFACKKQDKAMLDDRAKYWTPVDQYVGGAEHAVLHLLYARFFHKLLRDEGLLNTDEPFIRLLNQGMVLNQGIKMSKSKGNIVDPQPLMEKYGADTVRLFMIFASPPEQSLEWSDSGVDGAHRFLKRLWAFAVEQQELIRKENDLLKHQTHVNPEWDHVDSAQRDTQRQIYEILEQAKYDYERQQFNTVVSGCMKLLNLLSKIPPASEDRTDARPWMLRKGMGILLRLLAPITPHITHQLWGDLHFDGIIIDARWPRTSSAILKMDQQEIVVQINGKLRGRVMVPSDADAKTLEGYALNDAKIQRHIADQPIKKVITVPGKLINIVTG